MAFGPASKEVPELQLLEQKTVLTCALLLYLGGEGELQHTCQLPPECGTCLGCFYLAWSWGHLCPRSKACVGLKLKSSSHGLSVKCHQAFLWDLYHINLLFLRLNKNTEI